MSEARSVVSLVRTLATRARATRRSARLVAVVALLAVATAAVASVPSSANIFGRLAAATGMKARAAAAPLADEKASISTDKSVYHPGDTVTINGADFAPGETVNIVLKVRGSEGEVASLTATADANGSFIVKTELPEGVESVGKGEEVSYTATATGSASGASARTRFKAEEKEEAEGDDDADLPRFMIGKISKEDYLTQRQEH
ncbi:MAG TPA: hypothetical protein VNZ44_12440, partial [Pyrinomonadaceae bacterium]|nr:hypothetical protein [Pyrinomonadaceae bacterium]